MEMMNLFIERLFYYFKFHYVFKLCVISRMNEISSHRSNEFADALPNFLKFVRAGYSNCIIVYSSVLEHRPRNKASKNLAFLTPYT